MVMLILQNNGKILARKQARQNLQENLKLMEPLQIFPKVILTSHPTSKDSPKETNKSIFVAWEQVLNASAQASI